MIKRFSSHSICYAVLLLLPFYSSNAFSESGIFGSGACEKEITEPYVNAIVEEVFNHKLERLENEGKLPDTFWSKNKGLAFAVCDNGGSYDTRVFYGKGVVFDYQMIGFLFAQSRALIVGRYISRSRQFDVHKELVLQFVKQGSKLEAGPLAIIEEKAMELEIGKKDEYDKMLTNSDFKRREKTLFLQALYFLSMHERCHVALNHIPRKDKSVTKQQLEELEADKCAIDIINADEAQYKQSPVSFFGVLMTVATQAIVSNIPALATNGSHPSTRMRLTQARDIVLKYISNSKAPDAKNYEATIKGIAAYFDRLLADLKINL